MVENRDDVKDKEMSFVKEFEELDLAGLLSISTQATAEQVRTATAKRGLTLEDFAVLISPAGSGELELLGRRSKQLTEQRFGKTIRLFAPLYLSNECINNCKYCGFSRDNAILRVTLSTDEVLREARSLKGDGFRNILLVAGEHPKFVSSNYMRDCVKILQNEIPSISLEIGPLDEGPYRELVEAGAEGLVVYQETYDRAVYDEMHTAGPKKDFNYRLETAERAYRAGFRRLGIGALFGLSDWRMEALCVAAHAAYLMKHCWKSVITISLPRLRPCAGEFQPLTLLNDREFTQLICAFRLFLPDAGIVLSTREPAKLRDGLMGLGITLISAGSHTEPGGYTGAGKDKLHHTRKGVMVPANEAAVKLEGKLFEATGQFEIADERSASEMASVITRMGYDPVWKDWELAMN
ncbi:MAG: 2-iminoacetate synthase [Verrucomicrobiales bacterium]|nr:2-iminoacetate synthase [Verrucomicrobiales bacterium]